jgi:methylase of polypeptide subunit release factors
MPRTERDFSWSPCYADPDRGVAFFDGITIETDSIKDPRRDRVIPIYKEEQIFMCRQMRFLLEADTMPSSPLVLDIGTGSGIFAIWAAALGCRVVALDITPRSIRLGTQNARENDTPYEVCHTARNGRPEEQFSELRAGLDRLQNGSIHFCEAAFGKGFAEHFPEVFDLVIANPPFTPTQGEFSPADHAKAGEQGQEHFRDWIAHIPDILKPEGYHVGYLMSLAHDGQIGAFEEVEKVFQNRSRYPRIRYAHTLKSPNSQGQERLFYPAQKFLRSQYSSFLNGHSSEGQHTAPDEIEKYISQFSKDDEWAVIYYEMSKQQGNASVQEMPDTERYFVPEVSWENRIWAHKTILEQASGSASSFPSSSLFMQEGTVSDLPLSGSESTQGEPKETKWSRSPLCIADRWLQRRGAVSPNDSATGSFDGERSLGRPSFDLLVVDSAPYFEKTLNVEGLGAESKIWLNDSKGDEAGHLLKNWQIAARTWQELSVAPFLHPHFTGANYPQNWVDVEYTVFDGQYDRLMQSVPDQLRRTAKSKLDENLERGFDGFEKGFLQEEDFFSASLAEIEVSSSPKSYLKKLADRTGIPKDEITNKGLVDATARNHQKRLQEDLDRCHLTVHERLHELMDGKTENSFRWSALIEIPLSLSYRSGERNLEELPSSFRGGVWIFAASWTQNWTLAHEKVLKDLGRLLWLLYNGKYNHMAVDFRQDYAEMLTASAFSHETKHVISALDDRWLIDPDRINTTVGGDAFTAGKECITDKDLEEIDGWRIAPLPGLINNAGRMLRLWSQTTRPSDVFSSEIPSTWEDYIGQCWELAKAALRSFAVSGDNLTYKESFTAAQKRLNYVDNLPSPQISRRVDVGLLPQPALRQDDDTPAKANWMHLTRLLVAVFGNCLRHGYHDKSVCISLNVRDELLSIEVTNEKILESEKEKHFPDWLRNIIDQVSFSPLVSDAGGTKIIERHAEKLQAKASIGAVPDSHRWTVRIDSISVSSLENHSA